MGKQILPLCCWLLVGLLPFYSFGQDWNWIQSAGAPAGEIYHNREKGFEIAVDPEGNFLVIWKNRKLTTLAGLNRLGLIRGDLQILNNSRLWDCCPIEALLQSGGILGTVKIHQNDTGCESVPAVLTACGDLAPDPAGIGSGFESGDVASVMVLEIYPNPVSSTLHLRLYAPVETAFTLSILDLNGRTLYLEPLTAPEGVSDLVVPETAGLPPGMYTLVLRDGGELVVAERFLKI